MREMDKIIQPIETYYKGCRFRSRLEARWAVFFDACGVEWEYEPEGFRSGDIYYLPDFLLHGVEGRVSGDVYVEVKPSAERGLEPSERKKIEAVASHWNEDGSLRDNPISLIVVDNIFKFASGEELNDHYCDCGFEGVFYSFGWIDGDEYWPAYVGLNEDGDFVITGCGDSHESGDYDNENTEWALIQAKQARFEYGEILTPVSWKAHVRTLEGVTNELQKQLDLIKVKKKNHLRKAHHVISIYEEYNK